MFDSFDENRDGLINTTELGHALANYGYARLSNHVVFFTYGALLSMHLSPYIVDTIMKKYNKAPSRIWQAGHGDVPTQMNLDHFVSVCVDVRRTCDLYEKYIAGGQTQLSRDDFLRTVIPLP